MQRAQIGIGLIGTGYMGKAHALAYRNVRAVFGDVPEINTVLLADVPREKAEKFANQFGFEKGTADWRDLLSSSEIDVISITTPNHLHKEMALEAIAAGKHVWCEKPMALTLEDAMEMETAARKAGVITMTGYNYLRNPAFIHAQKLIEDGAIGRIVHFRGWVDEDYQADPSLEWSWRAKLKDAGLGTLGDLGCHLVSLAYGLIGPIESLVADMQTVHETRPLADGTGVAPVENEDTATALIRFKNGVQGSIGSSRSAWGRKNRLAFEVHGTKGMICFDQERLNELQLYQNDGPTSQQGFKTILTGPDHAPYDAFCPAGGHQIGFNDLKVIEARDFLQAIAKGEPAHPSFSDALEFEKVIHAIATSAREGSKRVHI